MSFLDEGFCLPSLHFVIEPRRLTMRLRRKRDLFVPFL